MIYRHLYVDKIMVFVDTPFVKILTGIRRCGKSTILDQEKCRNMHKSPCHPGKKRYNKKSIS